MSNICKTVTLRTRKIKKGTQLSFYLDYYPGYRDESTMKVQRHESLGIYIFAKPKNQREKDYNERMTEKAEALRCRRYESIVNERYDFFDRDKMKGDFLAYFKMKADKKNCKWQHVYKHFARFCNNKCRFDEINVDFTSCTSIPLLAIGQHSVPCFIPPIGNTRLWRIQTASLTGLTPSLRRKSTCPKMNL